MTNKIIVVCGATATGKSAVAIQLAKMLNTEIISCDSMQIYKNMNIGTAKITCDEMCGIRHHLLDIVAPTDDFSVSQYVQMAQQIIEELHSNGKIPIVVGGTGLYVDGLIYPMSFAVNKNEQVRIRLTNELEMYGADYLHNKLKLIDPIEAEKIHKNNTKRLIRALEIYEESGIIKSDMQEKEKQLNYDVCMLFLNPPRQMLYDKINLRVDQMFENNLLEELKTLLTNGVNWSCQSMKAIGYKEFLPYFENQSCLDQVAQQIKLNSRHYAKRQITWFKRYEFAKEINPYEKNSIENCKQIVNEFICN